MPDTQRYIEVVASSRMKRAVESYRAKIELTVEANKKRSCLDESIALRDQVIAALEEAGISAEDIEEAGGNVALSRWSSSKSVAHELHVANPEMPVLVQAMANVERVFTAIKRPWFSGVKQYFTFSGPTPEFADDAKAAEDALKKGVTSARSKATILAHHAGLELGDVLSIVEERPRRAKQHSIESAGANDSSDDDDFEFEVDEGPAVSYSAVSPPQGIARTLFRVRFAVQ